MSDPPIHLDGRKVARAITSRQLLERMGLRGAFMVIPAYYRIAKIGRLTIMWRRSKPKAAA